MVRPTFYAMRCEDALKAHIRLASSGDGFQLHAGMEIAPGDAPDAEWERIDDFEFFARSSPSVKARHWGEQYRDILAARQDPISDS